MDWYTEYIKPVFSTDETDSMAYYEQGIVNEL